jgi:RsiW-degrading membrane proteinase PrsW (M82 family)
MDIIRYLSFVIAPAIALLIYLYLRYRFPGGSFNLLLKSYLWGMASIALVLVVQLVANIFGLDHLTNLRRIIFYSLVVTAFFAEFSKFFFLKVFCYPQENFRTPVDGIIYSVMIAMGFATMNSLLYFLNIPNLKVGTVNLVMSGPANVIFGVLMGFFIGLGKIRKIRLIDSMTGLSAAVLFHALYSFCLLTKDYKLLWALFIGSAIIVFSLGVVALRITPETPPEETR